MTHPRDAKGRFIRRTSPAPLPPTPSPDPSRRAAGQLAAAATRLRQPLDDRPTSILIAAMDDLPVVMRMTVSNADDPPPPRGSAGRRTRHDGIGGALSVIVLRTTLMVSPSSPVGVCGGLPQPW